MAEENIEKDSKISRRTFEPMQDPDGFMEDVDVMKLIDCAKNETMALIYKTCYYTGRRISEVLAMRGSDIRQTGKDNLIKFRILKKGYKFKKSKKEKRIALEEPGVPKYKAVLASLIDDLIMYMAKRGIEEHEHIFLRWNGERQVLSRQLVHYYFQRDCIRAGIERVGNKNPHPHHLRHSFAVKMAKQLETVEDLILLKNMMEHSSTKVTEYYLQFAPKRESRLLEKTFGKIKR